MEMMLEPDSEFYEHEFELDLTKLPGWQEADVKTRERIINGAKKFIEEYNQVAKDCIEENRFYQPESAGFKALLLLLQESTEILNTLSSDIWQRWASIIIAFPYNSQKEQDYKELIKWAYLKAPNETLNTLVSIIDNKNKEDNSILILHKFEKCWDERFKAVIVAKAKDTAIKSPCLEQLLEELLKQESTEAREFAQSLVSIPLPLEEEAHQKALVAAKVLVEYAEPISWAVLWSVIRQNTDFGREIFESVTNRYVRGIHLKLTEKQLADLYIWLVWQYPYAEDPDHSNEVIAHNIDVRESVASLRDSVLTQLRETGTSQACTEIERIAGQFPELTWLTRTLFNAKNVMRRENWERQPFRPEQILQIVSNKIESQNKQIQANYLIRDDSKTSMVESVTRNQVFISYSHKDKTWLEQLQIHLKPMIRKKTLQVWDDTQIKSGDIWREKIKNALAAAKVAILMVSPNFLASDFIAENELPPLLDAAETEGLTIIWIPLSYSLYEETEIEKYQAAHPPDEPLGGLSSTEQDKAWVDICKKIKAAAN
jgi:hypothetical protein